MRKEVNLFYGFMETILFHRPAFLLMNLHHLPNPLPQSGVYFIFEENELRDNGFEKRIVRIGKGGGQAGAQTLTGRLNNHLNGNVETSIFRQHVQASIDNMEDPVLIQDYMNNLLVSCITIPNVDDRNNIEKHSISLISNSLREQNLIDPVSEHWLGSQNPNPAIINSGLWNVHHINV